MALAVEILVIAVLATAVFLVLAIKYQRTPLLGEQARRDRAFFAALPRPQGWFVAALYSDETIGTWGRRYGRAWAPKPNAGAGFFFGVRRLSVTLKHRQPGRDRQVFRAMENPNTHRVEDSITAFSRWIEAARQHDVPAVYRSGKQLHILSPKQMEEVERDPVAFLEKLQEHIRKGEAVPEYSYVPSFDL